MHDKLIAIAAAILDSSTALAQMKREAPALGVSAEEAASYAPTYLEHTMHDILAQDPTLSLRRLKMPVLAITGDQDTETPAATQLPALQAQLKLAGNQHVMVKVVPQVNHFFQTNVRGQEKSIFDNPETFSPVELQILVQWLAQQAGLVPHK
jgi:pimeloyl-ACP methyl ester carboxylesterase